MARSLGLARWDLLRPLDMLSSVWSSAAALPPVSSGAAVAYRTLFMTLRRLVVGRTLTINADAGDITLTVAGANAKRVQFKDFAGQVFIQTPRIAAPRGDLAHELEFLYEGLSAGLLAPTPELFALLQGCHDRLAQMIDAVAEGLPVGSVDKLIERIKSLVHPSDEPVTPVALPAGKAEAVADPAADMVKISADLLDDLVNLAGETSIFRGRIEQQVKDARIAFLDLNAKVLTKSSWGCDRRPDCTDPFLMGWR